MELLRYFTMFSSLLVSLCEGLLLLQIRQIPNPTWSCQLYYRLLLSSEDTMANNKIKSTNSKTENIYFQKIRKTHPKKTARLEEKLSCKNTFGIMELDSEIQGK